MITAPTGKVKKISVELSEITHTYRHIYATGILEHVCTSAPWRRGYWIFNQ